MTTQENTDNNSYVNVTYPSALFPGPPTIGLAIPSSWVIMSPKDYLQPTRKIDMAVSAPKPIDGVTPSISVNVLRTAPLTAPAKFLSELFDQESKNYDNVIARRYLSQPRPELTAVTQSQFPKKLMEHLQILSYVHDDRLAHIINITGVYAAHSKQGKQAIFNILQPEPAETPQP